MFLADVGLVRSPIHGWGVFARTRIPAGTQTWQFVPGVDQLLDPAAVAAARDDLSHLLVHHSYLHPVLKTRALCGDVARFMSHSATPTVRGTVEPDGGYDVAIRDIGIGEELTVDDRELDDPVPMESMPGSP